jgi:hypothetical protein
MAVAFRVAALAAAAVLALAACERGEPRLMNVAANMNSPDEFSILPTRPLIVPEDLATLPEPAPGGTNRADPRPFDDIAAALGGRPSARDGGIPAADGALVAHAARFGVEAGIRERLAAEDLEFRRRNDGLLLERLFNVNVYFRAYRAMALDRYAELARWRRLGVRTPAAPPEDSAAR